MKKLLLTLALLLGLASPTLATTRYASNGGSGSTCSIGSPCALTTAVPASGPGDTVIMIDGTWGNNGRINVGFMSIPSGTAGNPITIQAQTPGGVIIQPTFQGCFVFDGVSYLTLQNLICDGTNNPSALANSHTGAYITNGHDIRFENVEIKNWNYTIVQINPSGHDNVMTGGSIHDSTAFDGYCFYISGQSNIFEYMDVYNCRGYGFHVYSDSGGVTNNIIRYNKVHDNSSENNSGAAILLSSGSGNQAYGNVVYINYAYGIGVGAGTGGSNTRVFNNSLFNNVRSANGTANIGYGGPGSGNVFKNNIIYSTNGGADWADTGASNQPTYAGNLCTGADATRCAANGNPLFVNSAGGNFSLQSTSPAINLGTASIASGITACKNNTNPAAGAVQDLPQPTLTVNGTAAVLSQSNNCTGQMLPASSITGFSVRKATVADAITGSVTRSGTNSAIFTLTSAFVGGNACDFSYNQGTGNWASDNNIGGASTSNQEIFAFTNQGCSNITAGTGSVGLSHWRVYLLQGATDTTWVAKCAEDSANCTVAPGSKLWVRSKLRNNSGSNYPTFNSVPRWRYNGGSYVTLTNANYVNAIKVVGNGAQLGTVISDGATLTQDQLTSNGTNVAGQAIRSTGAFPSLTLNDGTESENAQAIEISTSATPGDTYESCPFDDIGTALTCATPIKITIGSYASAR